MPLRVEDRAGVRHLLLTRAGRRNPLTEELRGRLADELESALRAGRRVLLLSAEPAGHPVFAAGADLADIGALGPGGAPAFAERGQALFRAFEDAPLLVLAAVDGPCFGGALDLALSCDLIAASGRARFAHPGLKLGIVTGWGGTRRLPRALGPVAAEAFVAGRVLGAEEAHALGLVRELWAQEGEAFARSAVSWARGWAETLAREAPERIGSLKRVLAAAEPGAAQIAAAVLRRPL